MVKYENRFIHKAGHPITMLSDAKQIVLFKWNRGELLETLL